MMPKSLYINSRARFKSKKNGYNSVRFTKEGVTKTVDRTSFLGQSPAFQYLSSFDGKRTFSGINRLDRMFIGVQAIENNYYIICEVLDADSGSHAVVFLYDFEKNKCSYCLHQYVSERFLSGDFYLIPVQ